MIDDSHHTNNLYLQTVLTINSNYVPSSRVCDVLIRLVQDLLLRHDVDVVVNGKITKDIAQSRMIFDT